MSLKYICTPLDCCRIDDFFKGMLLTSKNILGVAFILTCNTSKLIVLQKKQFQDPKSIFGKFNF